MLVLPANISLSVMDEFLQFTLVPLFNNIHLNVIVRCVGVQPKSDNAGHCTCASMNVTIGMQLPGNYVKFVLTEFMPVFHRTQV